MFTSLRQGDKGPDVLELKRLLNKKLVPSPRLTENNNTFGPKTKKAVKNFQNVAGLSPTGEVGFWTWVRLYSQQTPDRPTVIKRPLPPRPTAKPPQPPRTTENQPAKATIGTVGNISQAEKDAAPWMKFIAKEVGQTVIPGPQNNKRILEYHLATTLKAKNDETAWCSAFVNWILNEAGYRGTRSAAAISWINAKWGEKLEKPRYGAITVVYNPRHSKSSSGNHVSFFLRETKDYVYLLGGNQGKIGTVKISGYPKNKFIFKGYRWPTEDNKIKH